MPDTGAYFLYNAKTRVLFTETHISIAGVRDIPVLTLLLNSAYRGESSLAGWTSEAHLIEGDVRTDENSVKEVIEKKGSIMLKYEDDNKQLIGCVNLQLQDEEMYLGMFAVSPLQQGSGIGKKLLKAAEEYTRQAGCSGIYMTVISLRSELVDWYKRHGYLDTGIQKAFMEDGRSGRHLQQLSFVVLRKHVQ